MKVLDSIRFILDPANPWTQREAIEVIESSRDVILALTAENERLSFRPTAATEPVDNDPYDSPIFVQGHSHSEPVCAWPDCRTYLTREQMSALRSPVPVAAPTETHARRRHPVNGFEQFCSCGKPWPCPGAPTETTPTCGHTRPHELHLAKPSPATWHGWNAATGEWKPCSAITERTQP